MTVAFAELEDSPRIRVRSGEFEGVRRFLIDWQDWPLFLAELLGGVSVSEGDLVVGTPAIFPGAAAAVVEDVDVRPLPDEAPLATDPLTLSSQTAVYQKAEVTVVYRMLDGNAGGSRGDLPSVVAGTHLTYESRLAAEQVPVAARSWKWQGSSVSVPEDLCPRLLVAAEDIVLNWQRVPRPPWDAMRDLRGRINDATFLNYPAGQVLFVGARSRSELRFGSDPLWRVEYRFQARSEAWNKQYRDAPAGWQGIEDGDGNPLYETGDFSQLFTMDLS